MKFTSATDVTLTLYGQGENGSDKVETLKYTVSDGKASVTYNEKKITTSAIKDDTFTASLDGTYENTCSFSTTPGKKYQDPTPDPDPTPTPNPDLANPFAGKTFYGSMTFDDEDIKGTFDVTEIRFKDAELTLIMYGGKKDGSDDYVETTPYTVADGKATMTLDEDVVTTSVITNDTFTVIFGTDEEAFTISFSRTQGTRIPEDPDAPTPEIKTAAQLQGSIGKFDLEWTDGVAVVEKELESFYTDAWNNDSDSTISFALLTVKDGWDDGPCYKETEFNFGEEVSLKISTWGNNIITSTDSLAGKKIKLTFTGTEETIKCKAEITEVSAPTPLPHAVQLLGSFGDFDLEWTDGVAVVEKELNDSYTDTWSDEKSDSTISFALLTVKDKWEEPCYKGSGFNFGGEVDLKIATQGNNIITSKESLAGKKIKLTFTETEKATKCKAEIVE